ncbi:MAG: pyrimidine-nucleoside phosphorylase, partial [Clostridia bacterium]|nr:pyrimidine-nucleoside phosphorylase [Clostridia bacterium]
MRMYDILQKKRYGEELTREEIEFFIKGYTEGTVPDYQAAAFCMAVCFAGMTDRETAALTDAMARSGDTVDLSRFGNLSVDKHSTGGVGDKTSLILCPIVSSLGCKVAKMSGRGLGHTGGTVDKLESIPGYRTSLSEEEFLDQVERTGLALIGQTGNLTPADTKLYALRDVTATIDSIPLITSSIMSKKLAAGSKNIVLDVKTGSGAFMKTPEDAEKLAENMVRIGKSCGRNVSALLTDMDRPLGFAVGNSLEVIEAVNVLKGLEKGDLYEVSVSLATEMVSLVKSITPESARREVENAIETGKAFAKMKEWITAQGGDTSVLDDTDMFPKAAFAYEVRAPKGGRIRKMNAEDIGKAAAILGAGRISKEDPIDHAAGIVLAKKTGDSVKKGDVIATLFTNNEASVAQAEERFLSALEIGRGDIPEEKLILKII